MLAKADVTEPATTYACHTPRTVKRGTPRALVLDLMQAARLHAVPEVDHRGVIVGLHTVTEMLSATPLPNHAVIMAGGRGSRLGMLTANTPKPLMTVAGRSILEWIILGLVGGGIRTIHISVNYLADQIVDAIGDGSAYGCTIRYMREEPDQPLGTGGSLTLLDPRPTEPIIVMNGDLMVEFDATRLVEHHRGSAAAMTVGIRSYSHTVPYGVVEMDAAGRVTSVSEKPELEVDINTAVYCIDPPLIDLLPSGQPSNMPDLIQGCLDRGLGVSAWPLTSDWIDVGTPADLHRAKGTP
ncbi:MAG: NTP transferase domain-containing protein [Propionibacteriaceae bacterium]|nr:NTP transferase domain-containing protein [Propionibacteriaceae bacterium]